MKAGGMKAIRARPGRWPLGTLTSQGNLPAASDAVVGAGAGLLGTSITTTSTSTIVLAATTNYPISGYGSTKIIVAQGSNSDVWSMPAAQGTLAAGSSSVLTAPFSSLSVTAATPGHAYTAGVATVSKVPSEFYSSLGNYFARRYLIHTPPLPDCYVDIAAQWPTAPPYNGVILFYGAEMYPFAEFISYNFESGTSGVYPVMYLVGHGYTVVSVVHPPGNAWNAGNYDGTAVPLRRLLGRCHAVANWVAQEFAQVGGTYNQAGSTAQQFIFRGGSGSSGIGAALALHYNLSDLIAPVGGPVGQLALNGFGAFFSSWRQASGETADLAFMAGSVNEVLLDDMPYKGMGTALPASMNYAPSTYGDGWGRNWLSVQSAIQSNYLSSPALQLHSGGQTTSSTSLVTTATIATGTSSGDWPTNQGRSIAGTVKVALSGGGYAYATYWDFGTTNVSNDTLIGVNWQSGTTGGQTLSTLAGGLSIYAPGASLAAEASLMLYACDGPHAKPLSALQKGKLTLVFGQDDQSGLPPLLLRRVASSTVMNRNNFILVQVPLAPHDVDSTSLGAQMSMAALTRTPTVFQTGSNGGNSLNGSGGGTGGTPAELPGFSCWQGWYPGYTGGNYTFPYNVNPGDMMFYIVWSSSTLPTPPIVTTTSPSSGPHAWAQVPFQGASASWGIPMDSGTDGLLTAWVKVAQGGETSADTLFTSSGTLYAAFVGTAGFGLDGATLNTSIATYYGGSSHTYTGGAYGIDTCSSAVGASTTSVSVHDLPPTQSGLALAIAFAAYSNQASPTSATPIVATTGAYYALGAQLTQRGGPYPDGAHQGKLYVAANSLTLGTSSDPSFSVAASPSCDIGAGEFILKAGSTTR